MSNVVVPAVCAVLSCVTMSAAGDAVLPPDDAYVSVVNGQLRSWGDRVRLWCVIGNYPNFAGLKPKDDDATRRQKIARAYADSEAILDRFTDLGFNGMRMWRYAERDYTKGDGSNEDVLDRFVWLAGQRGFRIWVPSIAFTKQYQPEQVDVLDDPGTAEAWSAAIRECNEKNIRHYWLARVWDPRMEEVQRRQIVRRATHLNRYTGLRWCDDPTFAIWELTNEEWWMSKMVGGSWRNLPTFFQDSLRAGWIKFLRDKYDNEAKLVSRWGFLLPGESLDEGTIDLLPLRGATQLDSAGMDPTALRQMEATYGQEQPAWTRDDFNAHRAGDVIEYFMTLQLAHKQRLAATLKSLGKSTRLGPIVFDTGIGYEIQSQYLHQNAEAVAHDAYINGVPKNRLNQRYPWYSGLEEWPRIAHDVPWLEHNRVEGKPYFCYETQIQQPAKYRAEFPLRILALASIQDWDAVCWHYWGSVGDITTSDRPFDKPMDVTTGSHPQGYHYTYDAVQNAVMRAAGYAFRQGSIDSAPEPTTFIYGRRALYDPASMDYAGSYGKLGLNMLPTTYQHGVRLLIDPQFDPRKLSAEGRKAYDAIDDNIGAAVKGPMVRFIDEARHTIIRPNDQITFDVQRGGLTIDAPESVMFTGFLSRFGPTLRFDHGVTLRDVEVHVPAAMPYSEGLADERYIAFALTSMDDRPLDRAQRINLTLVSTSFNTGFRLGVDNNGRTVQGELPVLTARVSGTIESPAIAGMSYRMLDWHAKAIGEGQVGADGVLNVPADQPIWVIELIRSGPDQP